MSTAQDACAAARRFQLHGEVSEAAPYGSGHINDSYRVVCNGAGRTSRYIVQRINHQIFKDPVAMMSNIERVTRHLAQQTGHAPDRERRVLTLIPTHEGQAWYRDARDNYWRAYRFIDNAQTYDAVESTQQAFEAAKAFGKFQEMLATLPAPRLHDTIPDFHHTPRRFAALEQAVKADVSGRVASTQREIDFAYARREITPILVNAGLPERVTHNDTKFNNVMLDDTTGEGICVIDLDTVMPGLALYDFGDMVRTTTSPAKEDEQDLTRVTMQFPKFEALVRGYLATAGSFLTKAEKDFLAFSGKLITFEIGLRFLTDHLSGDTYFKVHRDGHNLDRCRTQFRLVESIERQEVAMHRLVDSLP